MAGQVWGWGRASVRANVTRGDEAEAEEDVGSGSVLVGGGGKLGWRWGEEHIELVGTVEG